MKNKFMLAMQTCYMQKLSTLESMLNMLDNLYLQQKESTIWK